MTTQSDSDHEPASAHAWLDGGGETGALVRSIDWSKTPLGAIASWPGSLKTTVGTLLHSRHPMFLWWGRELIQIYNDAYVPSFGKGKHPAALGQRGEDCWQENWPIISPQIEDVMKRAQASWHDDQLVPVWRNERIEDVYWTYGYSPVFEESGSVGGTLVVCIETTPRVLAERRLRALRSLAQRTASATTVDAVLAAAAEIFETTKNDIPFAMIYARASDGTLAIAHAVGLSEGEQSAVDTACRPLLETPIKQAPIDVMFIAPIGDGKGARTNAGFIVFGLSPRLTFDDAYRDHLTQLTDHLALALARIETYRAREQGMGERERLLAELEQANRAKDEFLAMLGHELRNPLAPIVTALHLMKEQADGNVNREQEIIERQVNHLVRLVDDLLDVSRIARGKVTLRKELVEIGSIVGNAVEMAGDLLEEHRHQLSIELPLEGARIEGDPVRLAQVVANLLTNAARYTEPGGKISLRAAREGDQILVAVKDTGIGIDPELLPHVFDLFVQGRRSADRKEGGLGLGLALVKSFVTMHGGAVAARSDGIGRGSEFELRLPTSSKEMPVAPPMSDAAPAVSKRAKRILIVDDNIDSAEMMMTMLRSVGYEVSVAHDGPDALATAEQFSPDIALLDIGLPVMDGYELGERLHATAHAAHCRLIALTGYGQDHDRAHSKASGFEAHLVKPVDMRNLLQLLAAD